MTDKKYSRTIKGLKELLNTLPKGVKDFRVYIDNEHADYFEIYTVDTEYKQIEICGYYLNYN